MPDKPCMHNGPIISMDKAPSILFMGAVSVNDCCQYRSINLFGSAVERELPQQEEATEAGKKTRRQ